MSILCLEGSRNYRSGKAVVMDNRHSFVILAVFMLTDSGMFYLYTFMYLSY